ncbi:MAG: hypothetical protein JSS76_02085 [Bacteroidetes bacterium]|nr:hypothetical protein [Bacteroidota bacterium]
MKIQFLILVVIVLPAAFIALAINIGVNRLAKIANNTGTESPYLLLKAILVALCGYILSTLFTPMSTLLRLVSTTQSQAPAFFSQYYVAFVIAALTSIILVFVLSYLVFNAVYRKTKFSFVLANDEREAIYLFGGLLILFGVIVKEALPHFLDILIPYPQIPIYH